MKKTKRAILTAAMMAATSSSSFTAEAAHNVMSVMYGPPPSYEVEADVYGDANEDGKTKISDAILISRYANEENVSISRQGIANADLNDDKTVDMADAARVLKLIARLGTPKNGVGDFNENGIFDMDDLTTLIQRYLWGNGQEFGWDEKLNLEASRYDINGDTQLTIEDLYLMRELLLDWGYSEQEINDLFEVYEVTDSQTTTTTTSSPTFHTVYGTTRATTTNTMPSTTFAVVYGTAPASYAAERAQDVPAEENE